MGSESIHSLPKGSSYDGPSGTSCLEGLGFSGSCLCSVCTPLSYRKSQSSSHWLIYYQHNCLCRVEYEEKVWLWKPLTYVNPRDNLVNVGNFGEAEPGKRLIG